MVFYCKFVPKFAENTAQPLDDSRVEATTLNNIDILYRDTKKPVETLFVYPLLLSTKYGKFHNYP